MSAAHNCNCGLCAQFPQEGFPYLEAMDDSPIVEDGYSSTSESIGNLSDVSGIDDDFSEDD